MSDQLLDGMLKGFLCHLWGIYGMGGLPCLRIVKTGISYHLCFGFDALCLKHHKLRWQHRHYPCQSPGGSYCTHFHMVPWHGACLVITEIIER